MERYAKSLLKTHNWELGTGMPYEDLLQELAVKFVICKDRYAHISSVPNMISLFRSSCLNRLLDLVRCEERRSQYFQSSSDVVGEFDSSDEDFAPQVSAIGSELSPPDQAVLSEILSKCPREVRIVFEAAIEGSVTLDPYKPVPKYLNTFLRKLTGSRGDVAARFSRWMEDCLANS